MSLPSGVPPSHPSDATIRVMLVDDSSVVRGLLTRILETDPDIRIVSSVSNGQMAVDTVKKYEPHVIILDIEMPVMDGLTALPKLIATYPQAKILMCSTLTLHNADVTLKALAMGATDTIAKPTSTGQIVTGDDFKDSLINLVKQIGHSRVHRIVAPAPPVALPPAAPSRSSPAPISLRSSPAAAPVPAIVAIGSSTGGPQALFEVLKSCKGFNVPIVLTQHMPATFTAMLAKHITQHAGIPAFEGQDGMTVEPGKLYLAPGGHHMVLAHEGTKTIVRLNMDPPENFCRPAVDPLFRSVVSLYANKVLGVILTGMGHDGLKGSEELVRAGGRLIAQDEATSVVWGMPGAVATAGLCSAVLPLPEIGPFIRRAVLGG